MKVSIDVEVDAATVERLYERCRLDPRYSGTTHLYRDLRRLIQGQVAANEFDFDMCQTDKQAAAASPQ